MAISVIVPTWNEANGIQACIRAARLGNPLEIIVVDGGSTDDTRARAHDADRVLTAPPGRSSQMNAGAALARGDHLVFLHADCLLSPGWGHALDVCLRNDRVSAGCFRMRIREKESLYRAIEWCATARVKLSGMIYGDQGLFLRRATFESLHGFPPVRFMEDVLTSQRLRRLGRMKVADAVIEVSARRWQKMGLVRQTLRNWTLTALALAGVHPDSLAKYYRAHGG